MGKFIVFVLALCLIQGLHSTVAQTPDLTNIQNVVDLVGKLAKQIEETVQELPKRLPKIVQDLEESIQDIVADEKILEIFENLKEEIEKIVGQGSSKASCSKYAHDKLEDLNEETTQEVAGCLDEAQKSAENIKTQVESLMSGANGLAVEVAKRMETCVKSFGEDVTGLSDCLQTEVVAVEELLQEMKKSITETVDLAEDLSKSIGVGLRKCMNDVKENTKNYSNKVLNGVQNCMEEL